MSARIIVADVLDGLAGLPDGLARCCVTSPPYWGLRDYGVPGQIGLEPSPAEYVGRLVDVFREVRRVLTDDGTLWLNLGDSYAAARGGTAMPAETLAGGQGGFGARNAHRGRAQDARQAHRDAQSFGLKHKDLIGIPWRVALALQADGWWLRSDTIWSKPNPMPESVTDRPTRAHEYVFLLSKRDRYYYDAEAIAEDAGGGGLSWEERKAAGERGDTKFPNKDRIENGEAMPRFKPRWPGIGKQHAEARDRHESQEPMEAKPKRNARSVWSIATVPYREAHFATFPIELPRRCIAAGSAPGDTVLDPFTGAGTTGLAADRAGRDFVGVELNPEYAELARQRLHGDCPLFADVDLE